MSCSRCGSRLIMNVSGKVSDMCYVSVPHLGISRDGYAPHNMNIGGGDYLDLAICMNCGTVQGEWPLEDDTVMDSVKDM